MLQASILSNKRVICKLTITPTHKMAAPMWTQMAATRWPAGEGSWQESGQQGRVVVSDQASMGGQLGRTRPTEEGSWGQSSLQGRAVGGDPGLQGKADGGVTRQAGEQLGINQAGRGVVRG
uniref:Uncharacterized protein n=1 Tax=Pipistrellus kuhlii TaxID=59472 RepID=A0A7J8A7X4_PIPKU|nr:hypothetical protein mPipKuh1_009021 [Pipistrellus kuhlii]